jgi:hypothetical protein
MAKQAIDCHNLRARSSGRRTNKDHRQLTEH